MQSELQSTPQAIEDAFERFTQAAIPAAKPRTVKDVLDAFGRYPEVISTKNCWCCNVERVEPAG